MNIKTFLFYMCYGIFYTLIMLLNAKPNILYGNQNFLIKENRKLSIKTLCFPFLFFLFISFILFTVFRNENVGTDYNSYKSRCFDYAEGISLSDYLLDMLKMGFEPLFALISYIIKKAGLDFLVFLFIIYFIIFLSQITLFSNVKGFFIPFIFFIILVFPMILESFNIMRNSLAAFISIWGYIYLSKKRYLLAFVIFLISIFIHYSAIFCFMVWIMNILCNKEKFYLERMLFLIALGIILCYLLLPFFIKIMLIYNPIYENNLIKNGVSIKTMIFYIIVFIISIIYSNKLLKDNTINKVMLIAVGCALITIPLQSVMTISGRMLLFSHIPLFFLISGLFSIKITRKNMELTYCFLFLLLLLSLGWFYIHMTSISKDYGIDNYSNILINIKI